RVERFGIRFDVRTPKRQFRIEDVLVLRSYTPKQMKTLIKASECWDVVATHDFGYDIDDPVVVDDSIEDVVYVLKRT
ncbi:MAG: class I SAM-dependent methyltransferase, partial [Planctomycetota bacterium]